MILERFFVAEEQTSRGESRIENRHGVCIFAAIRESWHAFGPVHSFRILLQSYPVHPVLENGRPERFSRGRPERRTLASSQHTTQFNNALSSIS